MSPNLLSIISHSEQQTLEVGKKIGEICQKGTIISIRGPLGSGKTILAKGIALSLGITEPVTSPTFTIIQEYSGIYPLFHIDLYRLDNLEEFELLGGEELLYNEAVTIIEWSEIIDSLLPDPTISIDISIEKNQDRIIEIRGASL
jgi:tRNA threonylcarbamoyladenosine biosynthesis protein TsaE